MEVEEMGLLRRDTSAFCTLVSTQAETGIIEAEDPHKKICHKADLYSTGTTEEYDEKQRLCTAEPSAIGTKET
eukprot:1412107-Prymnesium_polylepis.4